MGTCLLSICIPTYNRETYLKDLLDSIVNQSGFSEKIEVFIYDDPSSDNTENMVLSYTKRFSNIKYHRNSERVGMMPAILNSILMCSGKYVWLFGSDDIMGPYGIQSILKIISEQEPDLILSNYENVNQLNEAKEYLQYEKYGSSNDFINSFYKHNLNYTHLKDIEHYVSYFSYMSIYCFNLARFRKNYQIFLEKDSIDFLHNHYFNYIYILFFAPLYNIILCYSPILTYNKSGGEAGWTLSKKILRDVKSINDLIIHNNIANLHTKIIFKSIFNKRYGWYIKSRVYKVFIKIIKKDTLLYTGILNFYNRIFKK